MKKLRIIFLLAIPGLLFFSKTIGQGIVGDGNVIEKERTVENFSGISVEEGIDLVLTQGEDIKVTVIADENLQDLIITKVVDGTLKIYPEKNIRKANKMEVRVVFKKISALSAVEGCDIVTTSLIVLDDLAVSCVEGCDIKLEINTDNLVISLNEGSDMSLEGVIKNLTISANEGSDVKASITSENLTCSVNEGSDIILKGTCTNVTIAANEGSDIDAFDLVTENCTIGAEEGSDAKVNVTKNLIVSAKESSDVEYKGNPENKKISSGEDCEVIAR